MQPTEFDETAPEDRDHLELTTTSSGNRSAFSVSYKGLGIWFFGFALVCIAIFVILCMKCIS